MTENKMRPEDVPGEVVEIVDKVPVGAAILRSERAAIVAAAWSEIDRWVRAKVAEELREDAAAHRRLVARKPSEYDDARLARAKTLDDAAARITRGERP